MHTPRISRRTSILAIVAAWLGLASHSAFALEGEIGIHDPSTVMVCDGSYYVYGTGRGISVLKSSDGLRWERGEKILERIPDSVKSFVPKSNGQGVWAPDIIKLNGEYYLYYSISAWGQFVSAVGLMTSPTLNPNDPNYKWTDKGMVVHSNESEKLNAIDPGVCHAPDGKLWLCYGSYHGNIELVELNPKTGLRIAADSPVSIIASHSEAADIIFHDGYYYLLVNHGSCCQGAKSTYNIRVGRSKKVTGPYLDREGKDMAQGAGTLFLESADKQIGPGHFGLLVDDGVEKFSCHYEADLDRPGRSVLDIRPLLWTADGWPMPGNNLKDGTYRIHSKQTLDAQKNPQWTITAAGGGFSKIVTAEGGLALQAAGATTAFAPPTGADNQLWKTDQLGDGSYRIVSKTGKLALADTSKIKPGTGMVLRAFTGADSQRWTLTTP